MPGSAPRRYWLPVLIWLLTLATASTGLSGKKNARYEKVVPLGFADIKEGDWCLDFAANLRAGDFFGGLRRIETRNGPVFRKGSEVVQNFPDQILVEITGGILSCSGDRWGALLPPPPSLSDLMGAMGFEVRWRRGQEMRPAETLSVSIEAQLPPTLSEARGRTHWLYKLTIRSAGVPLSDDLIITLLTPDEHSLARFTAHL